MIALNNINFSYSETNKHGALHNIQQQITAGECVLLCGKSGCGKTTMTKLVNGLIPHFTTGTMEGEAVVDSEHVDQTPLYKLSQKVGSVFQNPKSQFFNIDSDSELAFALENNGVAPDIIKKRIEQTVSDLHIEHLLNRNIFYLSGGEKQALAFASVYTMDPDIYVLDEPSANLDPEATAILGRQLKTIKNKGKTIIVAEHRLYYLTDLIDRVLYINEGTVERSFSREEFLQLTEDQRRSLNLRVIATDTMQFQHSPDTGGTFEISHLTYSRHKRNLFEDISISFSPGELVSITGRNGAGKSTFVRCLAGLIKQSSGRILHNGKPVSPKKRQQLCSLIMQDVNHQLFGESVWDECELSRDEAIADEEIETALEEFDLARFRDKHPMALSGGQKQRLAIVTGIIANKQIIIFDEPTSGLDYCNMCRTAGIMEELVNKGKCVIVITHDQEFLYECSKRVPLRNVHFSAAAR